MSQYPPNMQQQQQQQQFLMMQQMHMQQQYQYQQQLQQQQQASIGHQHFGTAPVPSIANHGNQPTVPAAPREEEDPAAALDIKSKKWAQMNSKRSY